MLSWQFEIASTSFAENSEWGYQLIARSISTGELAANFGLNK
jgi:hypothetical protein